VSVPRLVLLPGLDGTGDLFEPLLGALPSEVQSTVIRYGSVSRYSACRELVTQRLPLDEPYVLLGESFSGPVAIEIAATRPPLLRGVILVGSFASSPSPTLTRLASWIRLMPAWRTPQRISDFYLLGRFATPDLRKRLANALAQLDPRVGRARLCEIAVTDMSAELQKIPVPILYLRATDDRVVPRSSSERIAQLSPGLRVVDVEAPHLILQCAPRESAAAICDFIASSAAE
jgi:pimeloyl-ACP methyl ester carboxylesterase